MLLVAIEDKNGEIVTGECRKAKTGEIVTINCFDENGKTFEATGTVLEVEYIGE